MGENSGYKHYVAGLVSGVSMVIVGHPFDTVKVSLNNFLFPVFIVITARIF